MRVDGGTSYQIRAFGALELSNSDGICPLRPAHRRLLSILLIARGTALDRDVLIERMWPAGPPSSATNALQVHVSAIRRLAPGLVETTPGGYRVVLDGHAFDLTTFERRERESRRAKSSGDWDGVVTSCRTALELWRGRPLAAIADDSFAAPEVARLREMRLELHERCAQGLLAAGRADEAVPELEGLVRAHPLRERLWEHLMVGRYQLGRQSEALRAYREAAAILGEQLGIEPGPRLREVEQQILFQADEVGGNSAPARTNLPSPTTSFIGRDDAVEDISQLLELHQSVTITGPPGVGKSRLAIEVGRGRLQSSTDGVWLVDLSAATGPSDVSAGIAATLGVVANVADLRRLCAVVAGMDALVILDDCSHVRHAVTQFLAGLGEHDADLRVVLTGRQRLGHDGENVFDLGPLVVPEASATNPMASPAVRLLVERTRSSTPHLDLDDATLAALAERSRQTDGIPLALELTARWIQSVGLDPTAREGPDRAADPLRAALDASLEFLAASDRSVLIAASTFAGLVGIDAVAGVCAPEATRRELLGVVSRLVESSLLSAETSAAGRVSYRMLHPVREYCQMRLTANERTTLVDRHAHWFAHRASTFADQTHAEIGELMPDIRAAVRSLTEAGERAAAANLALAVRPYWEASYLTWAASEWLERILDGSEPSAVALDTLITAGWAAYLNHDYPLARTRYEMALRIARARSDALGEGRALFGLGRIETPIAPIDAESRLSEAIECFRRAGAPRDEAGCHLVLGVGLAWRGAAAEARPHVEACVAALDAGEAPEVLSTAYRYLSLCDWYDGDVAAATEHARRAEAIARDAEDDRRISGALLQCALVAVERGDLPAAAVSALEAFEPIPAYASIDLALVSFGAVPVLVEAGELSLAGEVFAMIDEVFDAHGWMRIDRRSPMAAELRRRAAVVEDGRSGRELRSAVTRLLSDLATR